MASRDEFGRTLSKHVKGRMAAHKKVMKYKTHMPLNISVKKSVPISTALEEAEEGREGIHDLINDGMEMLFNGIDVTPLHTAHQVAGAGNMLLEELKLATVEAIKYMDLADLDDLLYFMGLFNRETGAWYWNDCIPILKEAVQDRLRVIEEENEDD